MPPTFGGSSGALCLGAPAPIPPFRPRKPCKGAENEDVNFQITITRFLVIFSSPRRLSDVPEVLALDHVQLAMPAGGEDDARAFYGGLLGLPEVPKPMPLAARGGCWFDRGTVQLHLGVETGFQPARKAHPAFLIADLDGLAATLAASRHRVDWDDELPPVRRLYTDDPFGNRIELIAG